MGSMDKLQEKVLNTIKTQAMIPADGHVIVGLSGGMDSVCLLFVLLSLREQLHFKVSAVHVNHGLRGDAADADQDFAEKLCRVQQIPLMVFSADVRKMAAENGRSLEEAGRDYRYSCFEEALEKAGADRIAVAHHRDDLCETVLMNLCRGTGIAGLAGIPAVRGAVIRPLIDVSRGEIEAWMKEKGYAFCEDATNTDTAYTRNRIRHEILPSLETGVNAEAKQHIAETAGDAARLRSYIEEEAARCSEGLAEVYSDRTVLWIERLGILHEVLQTEIIRQVLEKMAGSARDLSRNHIYAVLGLMQRQSGRQIDLPYMLLAERDHDVIVIRQKAAESRTDEGESCLSFEAPCSVMIRLTGVGIPCRTGLYRLTMQVLPAGKKPQIPKKRYTKWFDYDRMSHELTFRTRLPDDHLGLSDGSHKKLRRVLMDAKVSREDRERLLIVADGNHVVWIPALGRIGDDLKVTQLTKNILEIQLEEITDERESKSIDS